jgi:hypothetical protein
MSTVEFMRVGEAVELIAFALGRRLNASAGAYRGIAEERLLEAARAGDIAFIAGTETWRSAVSFPLPLDCVHGLSLDLIDWRASTVEIPGGVPIQATQAVQELHTGRSTLWVSAALVLDHFGIEDAAFDDWSRARAAEASRPKIDWDRFHAEVTRHLVRDGVPESRALLERHMADWCARTFGHAPPADEIGERVAVHWQSVGSD